MLLFFHTSGKIVFTFADDKNTKLQPCWFYLELFSLGERYLVIQNDFRKKNLSALGFNMLSVEGHSTLFQDDFITFRL